MRANKSIAGAYVLLDEEALKGRDACRMARVLIKAGAGALQFRAKAMGDARRLEVCRRLAKICRGHGVPFIVNDRPDLALAAGADGVHLGLDDMPPAIARRILGRGKIIGLSSHSLVQARRRLREKPDYLAIGPVFRSGTKITKRRLLGAPTVRKLARMASCPVVAIGGVDQSNAALIMQAGASAVAVVASVLGSKDPAKSLRHLLQAMGKGIQRRNS